MAKKPNAPTCPSALAYARSIAPTPGKLYGADFSNVKQAGGPLLASLNEARLVPVEISVARGRGTISNYAEGDAAARVGIDSNSLENANLFTVEQALLPADLCHLLVSCEVKFQGNALSPEMCNHAGFMVEMAAFVEAYKAENGFTELATRYLLQMVNGSWLWRNRAGCDVEISVSTPDGLTLIVSEADVDMRNGFSLDALAPQHHEAFLTIRDQIASALANKDGVLLLSLNGLVQMGYGAEVFPSQEIPSDDEKAKSKSTPGLAPTKLLSRQVLSNGRSIATIHASKIGNAIRTIDTWHQQPGVGAIAVEPYGAQTQLSRANRTSGNDLYTYLKAVGDKKSAEVAGEQHYVMACLIRGGVFGMKQATEE